MTNGDRWSEAADPGPQAAGLGLTASDLEDLSERGISGDEARRQLELLRSPPASPRLTRAATLGDGIEILDRDSAAARRTAYERAAKGGRLSRFVPASGAASRMFADLERLALADREESGDEEFRALLSRFRKGLLLWPFGSTSDAARNRGSDRLASNDLPDRLSRDENELIREWLSPNGLADRAKGLLPFHGTGESVATAVEEHLYEAAALGAPSGSARVHFTVAPEHLPQFDESLGVWTKEIARATGCALDYDLSTQKPSTDTLSLEDGALARDTAGRLALRPGGHGALLENLERAGDLVLIKNIDNVLPRNRQTQSIEIQRQLVGQAALLQQRIFESIRALRTRPAAEALTPARTLLRGLHPEEDHESRDAGALLELLDRPLRVCGMVRTEGAPGGGPFWVERNGTRLQIIEAPQIDFRDQRQKDIAESATHFNPVLLVCALRNGDGEPFDLRCYSDPTTSFVTSKSDQGRWLAVLEHPGLWNGGMADWTTVFVEIPAEVFAPVKTVWDLLSPCHQA